MKKMEFKSRFPKFCRLCTGQLKLQRLFLRQSDKDLFSKLNYFVNLEILEHDELPKHVCRKCVRKIRYCYDFKILCEETDRKLRKSLIDNSLVILTDDIEDHNEDFEEVIENTFDPLTEEISEEYSDSDDNLKENSPVESQETMTKVEIIRMGDSDDENSILHEMVLEEMWCDYEDSNDIKIEDAEEDISINEEPTLQSTNEIYENISCDDENLSKDQIQDPENSPNKEPQCDYEITKKNQIQCVHCLKYFTPNNYRYHRRTHSENDIRCEFCPVYEISNRSMRAHIRNVHNLNPDTMKTLDSNECGVCMKVFHNFGQYKQHMQTHKEIFECEVCKEIFYTESRLKIHQQVHVGQGEDGRYPCDECHQVYKKRENLRRHWKQFHSNEKPYACHLCAKTFSRRDLLARHLPHHTESTTVCEVCGKQYTSAARMKQHLYVMHHRTKTMKSTKSYHCETCDKDLSYVSYRHHQIIHSGKKPYKCGDCGMGFTGPQQLAVHVRIHNGVKPYKCNECSRSFCQQQQLQCHLLTHSGERPHKCGYCDKRFALRGNLRVHERIHTGERPYVCPDCAEGFIDTNALKKHRKKAHVVS